MYRVRKSWADAPSQLGAFEMPGNAERLAKAAQCSVYNEEGVRIYPYVVSGAGEHVRREKAVSKVWRQSALGGALANELKRHGCGSCCAAVAANLAGKNTSPEAVLRLGERLWGKPAGKESYALSVKGIAALLKALGVSAEVCVGNIETEKVRKALLAGKSVVCFTHAYDSRDPFAGGDHYVLAVGFDKEDKVIVANSSGAQRVQTIPLDTLCRYIYRGGTGTDKQWLRTSKGSAGIVIVG